MSKHEDVPLICPECGATVPRKAGATVACRCGKILAVGTSAVMKTPKSVSPPLAKRSEKKIARAFTPYPTRHSALPKDDAQSTASVWNDKILPALLGVIGILARIAQLHLDRGNGQGLSLGIIAALGESVTACVCLLVGAALASKLIGAHFGSLATAAIKLAAIALFVAGITGLAMAAGGYQMIWILTAIPLPIFGYALLLNLQFSLEMDETLLIVAAASILQIGWAWILIATAR
ncbi:MAG: hypothetical protein ABSG31_03770 [Tepidisphaeraceae bacterium]|jgi:hypothetical protein